MIVEESTQPEGNKTLFATLIIIWMVWLLSELIDEFCRNGHRLPAGNRANAVSVRPGCETWLHACRRDSFVALGGKSAI